MGYTQLKSPNLNIVGAEGLCLVYVREVFGVAAKYPTAEAGWDNADYKHIGETPPPDVAAPVWFNWESSGHVAVSVPGKGIYSTTAQGDKVFGNVQECAEYVGATYLGWSEDVNGVRVCEPSAAPTPAPSGKTMNLPANSGAWHLYKPGGPYNPNNSADYIAIVHPADYAPGGLTYPIVATLGNGVYRIKSPAHGEADLFTNGSSVVIS